MNSGGIEEGHAMVFGAPQNQRKLSAAENQAVNCFIRFHSIDDRQQRLASVRQENIFEQLVHVLFVNEVLLRFIRNDEIYSVPSEDFRIESRAHGKTRAEQCDAFQSKCLCMITGGVDDTDERDP